MSKCMCVCARVCVAFMFLLLLSIVSECDHACVFVMFLVSLCTFYKINQRKWTCFNWLMSNYISDLKLMMHESSVVQIFFMNY